MNRDDAVTKQQLGSQSYKKGYDFEVRVAELYRLLHYDVEHGRLFSGRQIDLFLRRTLGDLDLIRAVECKSGPVGADQIDSFHAKLLLARKDFPSAIGTIVSGSTFSDAVKSHAAAAGIHLILFRDLSAQLFDGHSYAGSLLRELSSNERYRTDLYVEPLIGEDTLTHGQLGSQLISEWLENPKWRQLTILGDVGTGKSFLSRMVAFKLAKAFLEDPLNNPLPLLIDLRNADRQFSLEGLILTHLATSGLSQVSFEVFQYALAQGQLVVILDGFDEMAARVTPQITTRNFHELARCVQAQAKVLLTCRTHYFKSRTDEEEVILGVSLESKSENLRELYWDLISRKGFKISYLRPFTPEQIEQYVKLVKPLATRQAMAKIHQTYNLMELSQRPMLLEMIIKSIDKLGDSEINQSTLYEVFTSAWIHRDQWRDDVLSSDEKLSFLTGLAQRLWQDDLESIHYSSLLEYIHTDLATRIGNQKELVEIDSEIRTASFLTRNDFGFYGFAHKSYQEYFYSQFLANQLSNGKLECLYTRRLSLEIVSFLGHALEGTDIEVKLEEILVNGYRPMISENIVSLLYGIRKNSALARLKKGATLVVPLPSGCQLQGAQLEQMNLEGAVLKGANLQKANLNEIVLIGSDLSGSNLSDATLVGASLNKVDLRATTMTNCDFAAANFEGADISFSTIQGADFADAQLLGVSYRNVDLRKATLNRAILPEDLVSTLRNLTYDGIRQGANVDESVHLDELWQRLNELRPSLIRSARRYGLDINAESEDVVDTSILRVMRDRRTIEQLSSFDKIRLRSYMATVVRHVSIDSRRARGTVFSLGLLDNEVLQDHWEGSPSDVSPEEAGIKHYLDSATARDIAPDQKVLLSEIAEIVRNEFSPGALEVFNLYFLEGMNISEIGVELKRSRKYVSHLVKNIRNTIKAYLT